MDSPISLLPGVGNVTLNDIFPIVQGGVTSRATAAQISQAISSALLSVSVKQFGVKGDGVSDDTAALAAARAYLAANATRCKLIFPTGIYLYSESPNWAIQNAVVEAQGEVRLRYTGAGNALVFDGGASSLVFHAAFTGNFIVEASSTAGHGVYVRSLHHSHIEARVAGCGINSNALEVEFAVCSIFDFRASGNEGWYTGPNGVQALPKLGINLTHRAVGENTSDCEFRVIIEAVSSHGIVCDYAIQNQFYGGTSEGNPGGYGLVCTANSSNNSFHGLDLETNSLGGIKDGGNNNNFLQVFNDSSITIDNTAILSSLRGGYYNSIVNNGSGTLMDGLRYSINGGGISGTGTNYSKKNVYNATAGAFDADIPRGSVVASGVNCASGVPTTVLTLPNAGNVLYQIGAYIYGTGRADLYTGYAVVACDGANTKIMMQTNGTNLAITMSGLNVQVNQTSGASQPVYAFAKPV